MIEKATVYWTYVSELDEPTLNSTDQFMRANLAACKQAIKRIRSFYGMEPEGVTFSVSVNPGRIVCSDVAIVFDDSVPEHVSYFEKVQNIVIDEALFEDKKGIISIEHL